MNMQCGHERTYLFISKALGDALPGQDRMPTAVRFPDCLPPETGSRVAASRAGQHPAAHGAATATLVEARGRVEMLLPARCARLDLQSAGIAREDAQVAVLLIAAGDGRRRVASV